jgi:hypothetical protein
MAPYPGMMKMALVYIESPQGQEAVRHYLSSPDGQATINAYLAIPQGKQIGKLLLLRMLDGLDLPDDVKNTVRKALVQKT